MAENPITVPLPADLPIDWSPNQIISPDGTSAGYTEQHGYNYLMEQVNAAQKAANELGRAFQGLVSTGQIGQPGGVASLDETGKVPESQLPNMNYDPAGSAQAVQKNLTAHINNKSNPHGVTAAQAGADPAGSAAAVQAALMPLINAAQSAAEAAQDTADAASNRANGTLRYKSGYYTGTGSSGDVTINLGVKPIAVFVVPYSSYEDWQNDNCYFALSGNGARTAGIGITSTGFIVMGYNGNNHLTCESGTQYRYLAIY